MATPDMPSWIQEASIFAVALTSIVVAVYRYIQTESGRSTTNKPTVATEPIGQVVAASFTDSRLLKELIDALREHSEESARIALRITRSQGELREAMLEASESVKMQTDATLNMLRFINRQQGTQV